MSPHQFPHGIPPPSVGIHRVSNIVPPIPAHRHSDKEILTKSSLSKLCLSLFKFINAGIFSPNFTKEETKYDVLRIANDLSAYHDAQKKSGEKWHVLEKCFILLLTFVITRSW